MPTVIVYVRESDWSALGEGAADRVRDFAADGIRQAVDGPGETPRRKQQENGAPPSRRDSVGAGRSRAASPPGASAPASPTVERVETGSRIRIPRLTAPRGVEIATGGKRFSGPDLRPSEKKARK